ncbi:MAG: ATP-dependent Clp protease proteolytic subunit [Actinomycetota bacterium]|nr:ATP-dependent Clp protease proteolytic subunit [Actinomycetota bacterium]
MGTGPEADDSETAAADPATTAGGPSTEPEVARPLHTPLFRAQHEDRYLRQSLIKTYEENYDCRLVVLIDQITDTSITLFTELLHDVDDSSDLHLMLWSPGGDGEVAVRLARMAQAACRRFVVVVPEMAKSAATILALGAHEVLMGPTSDLGPIDPQVYLPDRGFVSAKDLIASVDRAIAEVEQRPSTYPLMAAMLAGIDVTAVEFARSALNRTGDMARQAIASNPERNGIAVKDMLDRINGPLIKEPSSHGAVIGAPEAKTFGLPITDLGHANPQWRDIWALWTRYFVLGPTPYLQVYEGIRASQVKVFEGR